MAHESKRSHKNTRTNDPSEAPKDIAYGATFWLVGLIVRFFPLYAGIEGIFEHLYIVASVACYAVGFLGVAVGMGKLKSSEFARDSAFAFAILMVALLIHMFLVGAAPAWLRLVLQHIILILIVVALFGLAKGLAQLFTDASKVHSSNLCEGFDQALVHNDTTESRWNTRSQFILGVIVAVLTLASVLLQAFDTLRGFAD